MQTCLSEVETKYLRLLITGYSNSAMFCDDISTDQFLFFFLHAACDYLYFINSPLDWEPKFEFEFQKRDQMN